MADFKEDLMNFVYERKTSAFDGNEDEIVGTVRDLTGVIGVLLSAIYLRYGDAGLLKTFKSICDFAEITAKKSAKKRSLDGDLPRLNS